MAEVYLVYRVTPSDPNVDYGTLKESIRRALEPKYKVDRIDEEEVGFGIKVLRVHVRMPEGSEEHSSDDIENRLMSVSGVSGIELEYFTRIGF